MTDEERADLALAVGRRVRPQEKWDTDLPRYVDWYAHKAWCWATYDPTVPGEDSAEAESWLFERCVDVAVTKYEVLNKEEPTFFMCTVHVTATDCRPVEQGATPAEARARIIAAWPDGAGSG